MRGSQVGKRRYGIVRTVSENGCILRREIATARVYVLRVDLVEVVRSQGIYTSRVNAAIVIVVPSGGAVVVNIGLATINNVLLHVQGMATARRVHKVEPGRVRIVYGIVVVFRIDRTGA